MSRKRKKQQQQQEYYSLEPILKEKAHYNIIIGERSNGKTYSVLKKFVNDYAQHGYQAALLRRMQEDFIGYELPRKEKRPFSCCSNSNRIFWCWI